MHDAHAGLGGQGHDAVEQNGGGNVLEGGVAVGKETADVAPGEAAENGVHEGVEQHVAVGVGADAVFSADFHSAEHERTVAAVGVHVVAVAAAGQRHLWFGKQGKISGTGDFDVVPVPFDDEDRKTAALHEGGVVGDVPALGAGPLVGRAQFGRQEGLRGLHGAEAFALGRADDETGRSGFLDGVGDGHAGNDAGHAFLMQGAGQLRDQGRAQKGTCAVVDEHAFAGLRQNVQRVPYGILTPFSASGKAQRHAAGMSAVEFKGRISGFLQPVRGKDQHKTVHEGRGGHGPRGTQPQRLSPVVQKLLGLAARGLRHAAAPACGENDAPAFVVHDDLGKNEAWGGNFRSLPMTGESDCKPGFVPFPEERRLSFL